MEIAKACPIPAAQRLLDYIRNESGLKAVTKFCDAHGLDRLKVARALKGGLLRVDVEFAFAIEAATGGEIPAESWCIEPALRKKLSDRRKAEKEKKAAKAGKR